MYAVSIIIGSCNWYGSSGQLFLHRKNLIDLKISATSKLGAVGCQFSLLLCVSGAKVGVAKKNGGTNFNLPVFHSSHLTGFVGTKIKENCSGGPVLGVRPLSPTFQPTPVSLD
jgi:hypothetical protein